MGAAKRCPPSRHAARRIKEPRAAREAKEGGRGEAVPTWSPRRAAYQSKVASVSTYSFQRLPAWALTQRSVAQGCSWTLA